VQALRQFVEHVGKLVTPAALLAGLRPDLAGCSPEAKRTITDGEHRGDHAPPLELTQHRLPAFGTLPIAVRVRTGLSKLERDMAEAEYQLSLMQLLDLLPCIVVNRAKASTSNDSKLYQAFLAESFGLRTPATLVTTDPDEVREFYHDCQKRVIYKSLSSVRSIVNRLNDDDLADRLSRVRNCPTQFQECVDGVDIRVHVVGERVFATEIVSDVSDYRYAGRQGASLSMREIEIPAEIAHSCIGMSSRLGLVLAGVDLRRTPEGLYYCFEINPSPGFIFYEKATGQPISEAVAQLLRGGA
jgi:glutathione synthase/RimK-type ligase-like ATP-grasp enzyme